MSVHYGVEYFRSLHHSSKMLILPNAWDVPTARLFENAGFKAVATTSAGMMVSLGYEDGETIPREEYINAVAKIAKVISIPLSVDIVSGFGRSVKDVTDTVKEVAKAGALGINIEDFEHNSRKLFPLEEQVEKIKGIKRLGIDVFVNARTDALRFAPGNDNDRLKEAIIRGRAYKDAGADCVYPMGLFRKEQIAMYVEELDYPVNIMVRQGIPSIKELEELHVARLSFGPSATYAVMSFLKRISNKVLQEGNLSMLVEDTISYEELNSLAKRA